MCVCMCFPSQCGKLAQGLLQLLSNLVNEKKTTLTSMQHEMTTTLTSMQQETITTLTSMQLLLCLEL